MDPTLSPDANTPLARPGKIGSLKGSRRRSPLVDRWCMVCSAGRTRSALEGRALREGAYHVLRPNTSPKVALGNPES